MVYAAGRMQVYLGDQHVEHGSRAIRQATGEALITVVVTKVYSRHGGNREPRHVSIRY